MPGIPLRVGGPLDLDRGVADAGGLVDERAHEPAAGFGEVFGVADADAVGVVVVVVYGHRGSPSWIPRPLGRGRKSILSRLLRSVLSRTGVARRQILDRRR